MTLDQDRDYHVTIYVSNIFHKKSVLQKKIVFLINWSTLLGKCRSIRLFRDPSARSNKHHQQPTLNLFNDDYQNFEIKTFSGLHGWPVFLRFNSDGCQLPPAPPSGWKGWIGKREPGCPPHRVFRAVRKALQLHQHRHQDLRRRGIRLQGWGEKISYMYLLIKNPIKFNQYPQNIFLFKKLNL